MTTGLPSSLHAIARRHARAEEVDDIVQSALLAAIEAGRTDFASGQTRAWLAGVIRNKARMAARSAARQRSRETCWHEARGDPARDGGGPVPDVSGLPPSLRLTALLAFSGATRAEIGWLLGLSDTALRQRISQLKRALDGQGDGVPGMALSDPLPFGALRRSMVARLKARGGFLASHDPDGHIFVLARSQIPDRRQQEGEKPKRRTSPCSHP